MEERDEASRQNYPLGRGYGADYMRGGEVLGGYGYSAREEYARPRGELRERRSDDGMADDDDRPETD
ncbi:MAG TPA: hypothetical protein VG432_11940 [Gemmatimonadaceae bacterium]|nr:hypothetical protein [Gemmatimonadaceae bacterium]